MEYLGNYAVPAREGINDRFAFYVTTLGLLLAIPALVFRTRLALPALVVFLLSAWASLGVNGYLPQLLYLLKVPSIQYFRQWYHFVPIMNLCLSALGAIGFSVVAEFAQKRTGRLKYGAGRLSTGLLLLAATGVIFFQSSRIFKGYVTEHMVGGFTSAELDDERFLRLLTAGTFEFGYPGPLVVYRDWFRLTESCPDVARLRRPFVTGEVYEIAEGASAAERQDMIRGFCEAGFSGFAVIGEAPGASGEAGEGGALVPGLNLSWKGGEGKDSAENRFFPKGSYRFTPSGGYFNGAVEADSLVVLPFNRKLGLKAYLNGESVGTYSVYDGAMTGVLVPTGPFSLRVDASMSGYRLTVLLQGALLAGVVIFFLAPLLRRKQPDSPGKPQDP